MPEMSCKVCGAEGECPSSKKSICIKCFTTKKYKELKSRYPKGIPDAVKNDIYNSYFDLIKEPRRVFG